MGFISITSPHLGNIYIYIFTCFLTNHLKLIKVRYAEWRRPLRHISSKSGRWDNDLGAQRTSPSTEDLRRDALLALPNPVVKVMMLEWLWPAKKQQMQLLYHKWSGVQNVCLYIYTRIYLSIIKLILYAQRLNPKLPKKAVTESTSRSKVVCRDSSVKRSTQRAWTYLGKIETEKNSNVNIKWEPTTFSKCHAFPTKNLNITTIGVSKQQASSADSMTLGERRGRKTQASNLSPRNIGPQGGASHK